MSIWRLLTRLVVGGFVFGHGTQKLFGWFGGAGIEGTAKGFEKAGLRPGPRNAVAAGLAETGGGALLVTGLATPLGATLVTGTMLTAIEHVHRDKGPWNQNGGYEYPVVLIATAVGLAGTGPGRFSLDAAIGLKWRGAAWAAFAIGGGSLGAYLVEQLAARNRPDPVRLPVSEPERAAA